MYTIHIYIFIVCVYWVRINRVSCRYVSIYIYRMCIYVYIACMYVSPENFLWNWLGLVHNSPPFSRNLPHLVSSSHLLFSQCKENLPEIQQRRPTAYGNEPCGSVWLLHTLPWIKTLEHLVLRWISPKVRKRFVGMCILWGWLSWKKALWHDLDPSIIPWYPLVRFHYSDL